MSYVRVSILGTLVGGEVWSVNPVFDPEGEFGSSVSQSALDSAALAIANLTPGLNMQGYLSSAASITGVRLEVRDDATDALLAISTQMRSSPLVGSGTANKPAQTAMVVSIRTNTPGGSGRGRIYWPALASLIGSDLRFNAANVTSLVSEFKTYFASIAGALATAFPTIGFLLSVRSKTTGTTPHAVRIQIGNVPDVQRRRRDALPEAYTSIAVP